MRDIDFIERENRYTETKQRLSKSLSLATPPPNPRRALRFRFGTGVERPHVNKVKEVWGIVTFFRWHPLVNSLILSEISKLDVDRYGENE